MCQPPAPLPPRLQAKVDALKVDSESYAWYRSRLRIEPRSLHFAQLFIKSVLALLSTAGLRFHPHDVFRHLDDEVNEESNNPFEYANMLERDDVGAQRPLAPPPAQCAVAADGTPPPAFVRTRSPLRPQACRTLRAPSCARHGGSGRGRA